MTTQAVLTVVRQELLINIRNKWTLIFSVIFGTLVIAISYFGIMAEGFSGMQNFTRTSASILNLVLYIIPLVALVMGTMSFTGDKGSMELLFSQPLPRTAVIVGKLVGVFASLALATLIGFTLAGVVIVSAVGLDGVFRYIAFVLFSLILSFVFFAISVLVATACKRKSRAFGVSLFVWFFFLLFYDLVALGGTLFLRGQSANYFLFISLFGNPVDMVRVASLISLDNITIFGAAGAALLRFLGGVELSSAILIFVLTLWVVVPLILSHSLLKKQDI